MRHIREPLTFATHNDLIMEVLNTCIGIKIHYFDLSKGPNQEAVEKAKSMTPKPTWENVENLLQRCRKVIDTIRENPIKY